MSTFSEILKRERENKGYSKAELARKLIALNKYIESL